MQAGHSGSSARHHAAFHDLFQPQAARFLHSYPRSFLKHSPIADGPIAIQQLTSGTVQYIIIMHTISLLFMASKHTSRVRHNGVSSCLTKYVYISAPLPPIVKSPRASKLIGSSIHTPLLVPLQVYSANLYSHGGSSIWQTHARTIGRLLEYTCVVTTPWGPVEFCESRESKSGLLCCDWCPVWNAGRLSFSTAYIPNCSRFGSTHGMIVISTRC